MRWFPAILPVLLAASCATEPSNEEEVAGVRLLAPRARLIRLSVDLRGVHPSEAELAAIDADPDLYEDFVDRYLEDPRFVARMGDVFNEALLTRTGDSYGVSVEGVDGAVVGRSIGDEAIKLVERIVADDLPYSEIVLADYTMANPVLADAFDLEYPRGQKGWEKAYYADGRPHAGVLTMTSFWLRYPSMAGNANRHRANAVSRTLLCDDYLARPIVLNRAAVDQLTVSPEEAISTNATCQSCHSTLDPLASHFFGFFIPDDQEFTEDPLVYRPEREQGWREYSGRDPGFYGVPTANVVELAELIADDSRFHDCAVETVFQGLTQRSVVDADWAELAPHRDAFLDAGLRVRPLVRSIVTAPEYLAESAVDEELAKRVPGAKLVSPAQLSAIVEDITGYRWDFGGQDLTTATGGGVPVLLGGIDGRTATNRSYQASVGAVLVQERLTWNAAWDVVQRDFAIPDGGERRLLRYVNANQGPDEAPEAFEEQVRFLYLRVTGTPLPAEAEEVQGLADVWRDLRSIEGSGERAWAGVVNVVLRDPAVLYY